MQDLEIPYRVVAIAVDDLGASAASKYDIEAWLPGQGRYRELTSTSNTTGRWGCRPSCRGGVRLRCFRPRPGSADARAGAVSPPLANSDFVPNCACGVQFVRWGAPSNQFVPNQPRESRFGTNRSLEHHRSARGPTARRAASFAERYA